MARRSKQEYVHAIYERYRQATRAEKRAMLDEFTQVCGYHRKYAIGLLNQPAPPAARPRRVPRRRPIYRAEAIQVLAFVWEASGYLCAVRLKAALPHWLPWLRSRGRLSPAVERALRRISARQMDRRLRAHKRTLKRTLYGTTRPGALLKHLIPIKTDHWDVTTPGYLEMDLVSHSGASAEGEFLHTLDCVDIHTEWVERQAVRGKGQHGICQALTTIEGQLPFALRGLDSDNGSEFINTHLWAFCQRPGRPPIQFTRSRPYKKDDNAHIEQKNWTHVRKLVGWERYDSPAALQALNALYADLRIFQNLFQPSMKLRSKERRGSRVLRRYDPPQTPFERVQACPEADPRQLARLQHAQRTTDPFALSARIDHHLDQLLALATRPSRTPRESRPAAHSPWRGWTFSPRLRQQEQAQRQAHRPPPRLRRG